MSTIDIDIENAGNINKSKIFKEISKKLSKKQSELEVLEKALKDSQDLSSQLENGIRKLKEEEMPQLMDELGVNSVTLSNGVSIGIDTSVHVGIPEKNKPEALDWLRENGHGDLIKTELTLKFNRNESNLVPEVKAKIEEYGVPINEKLGVNTMTLKGFVREQMRLGNTLPLDLFGVYIRRVVTVK